MSHPARPKSPSALLGLLLLVGCAGRAPDASPPGPSTPEETAATASGVQAAPAQGDPAASGTLAALGDAYWAAQMKHYPTWATYLGDRSRDDQLDEVSAAAEQARRAESQGFLDRVRAIDRAGLTATEQVTADVLEETLANGTAVHDACQQSLWHVDQLSGPQVGYAELPNFHTIRNATDAANLVTRYRLMGQRLDAHIANLKGGLGRGYVAPRIAVERVIRQLDELLATAPEQTPFYTLPIKQVDALDPAPEGLSSVDRAKWEAALKAAVEGHVLEGMRRYRTLLRDTILPEARGQVGVSAIPGGAACYQAAIRRFTGTDRTADELHELGLEEVERIRGEMRAIVARNGGGEGEDAVGQYIEALLKKPGETFESREALLEHNRTLVARASEVLPEAFGRLPKTPVEMKAIEPFREKDAPAAYYYGAADDGSRPAYYYVNTYEPEKRPRYSMAALAYHEAVPGHHLQIALSKENADLPMFQRQIGQTAFVEGWALYAERLSGELGLYRDDHEQLGALSYEIWRAARLVVDTGMHARGWSRDRALEFLRRYTGKDAGEAANEIDRYIIWPGQALAYKVGQLEILALRERARAALGDRFDLRAFHDVVLGSGAVPLRTLTRLVDTWIATETKSAVSASNR